MKVRKAIIPAAGLGTRLLPNTKSIPKEMLPLVDKPVIQYIVEEAVAWGAQCICLSGLITPSLDEMARVCEELERRGLRIPVIIGGATTSDLHTAVKIAPVYSGVAVHSANASRNSQILAQLLGPDGDLYADKVKADLFQHMLAPGVFHNGVCVHSGHSQLVKGDFYRQMFCLRSISFPFYHVILHMDTQRTFLFIIVDLFQLQFPDYLISKHDCKQPTRSV